MKLRLSISIWKTKVVALEACRSRIIELEHTIMANEELLSSQKRWLIGINEQRHENLELWKKKILDLRQRLEFEKGKRCVHSPDTSSCHEVNVTTTAGISPHSSPLSASLASSEGSTAFHEREAIVDQRESTSKSKFDDLGEVFSDNDGQLASSTKND
ncbi:hypothetical protein NQ314_009596 [Rhamnusium bicolor]|uniref:Uncharacterized protein n=1 Tax=Rhamnusium bicolor TaxID=1586634 RepID=A0AAV8Y085_9CUCU|nr:hypothetical protein NQ314_009596 [Rhamnusium bicolor]